MKFNNGDKVKILYGTFKDFVGEYYEDENGNKEIYVPSTSEHTSFNIVVLTTDMLEKYS